MVDICFCFYIRDGAVRFSLKFSMSGTGKLKNVYILATDKKEFMQVLSFCFVTVSYYHFIIMLVLALKGNDGRS